MNHKLAAILMLLSITTVRAQQYQPVDQESKIAFTAENFGIDVEGVVEGLTGKIIFNPSNLVTSVFNVSVDANGVDTGNTTRDRHLKGTDFFHTARYPAIRFVSTSITKTQQGYEITGLLTIKDVTKSISFPFKAQGWNNDIIFTGNFSIDRKAFNIGGGWTVARNVKIRLTVIARP